MENCRFYYDYNVEIKRINARQIETEREKGFF